MAGTTRTSRRSRPSKGGQRGQSPSKQQPRKNLSILQFSKPCDDPLTLSVGGCDVAVGETVKVGEKFGLRLTSMVMPEEKFEPLAARKRADGAGG